jgi:hypothetical protein
MEKRQENGTTNVEDEMKQLVSSAMEAVGHKSPEARKRQSSNSESTSASADAGPSITDTVHASGGDVQQFGNMQVIT